MIIFLDISECRQISAFEIKNDLNLKIIWDRLNSGNVFREYSTLVNYIIH